MSRRVRPAFLPHRVTKSEVYKLCGRHGKHVIMLELRPGDDIHGKETQRMVGALLRPEGINMLFSPSEKRASQLTQYYQLTVPDLATAKETDLVGSDIDSWFSRRQYAGLYSALEGKFTRWTNLFEDGLRDLVPLATIHPLLTRCMDAAADHTQPSREDQLELNNLIRAYVDPPLIVWDKGEGPCLRHGRSGDKRAIVGLMLSEFVMAIGDKSFTHCEVCDSVFPQSRGGQRYCSERCNSRAKSSRYYNRRKEPSAKIAA